MLFAPLLPALLVRVHAAAHRHERATCEVARLPCVHRGVVAQLRADLLAADDGLHVEGLLRRRDDQVEAAEFGVGVEDAPAVGSIRSLGQALGDLLLHVAGLRVVGRRVTA